MTVPLHTAATIRRMAENVARQDFARILDDARKRQHLSIRDAARIAGVPAATMQGWLSGRHFPVPALRPNYLRVVALLELTDLLPAGLWGESWDNLQPRLRTAESPYLGLRPFQVSDQMLYFGRRRESRRLAESVLTQRQDAGGGLIVVVGASGSGKSSLLAAGLLGQERSDGILQRWTARQLTLEELLAASPAPTDLMIVDQLEDMFTLDESARTRVLNRLTELVRSSVVVAGLRADAFARASKDPLLAAALAHPFLITPLDRDEVRQVVTAPARAARVSVDDELVQTVLDDLTADSRDLVATDALPLLSNALLVTWASGTGDRMTVNDYVNAGGVASAVQGLAENVFESLDEAQQVSARRLLLRLVRISGDLVVRNSLPLDDVEHADQVVLDAFVSARMLTVSDHAVRISHDALLTHWSRLLDWVDEGRSDLVVASQLSRAARVWHDSGRSPEALIPVERLEVFTKWLGDPERERQLSPRERQFVTASREHFASELMHEQRLAARLRRGRNLAVTLSVLTMALSIVTGLLYWQGRGLQAVAVDAQHDSQSRQVALEARSIRANDANLMGQMALVADGLANTRQASSILIDATATMMPTRWLGAPEAVLARSLDEQVVARANGSGEVTLWRGDELTSTPGDTFTVDPSRRPLYGLAVATVGDRRLLGVGGQAVAELWDITDVPQRVADLRRRDSTTYGIAFDTARRRLAVAASSGEVDVWAIDTRGRPTAWTTIDLGGGTPARSVDFSAATGELFVAGPTNALARWSLSSTPRRLPDLTFGFPRTEGPRMPPVDTQAVAVSPDGSEVAAGIQGRTVYRWTVDKSGAAAAPAITGLGNFTNDVSYSSDGKTLLVANSDQQIYLYDVATGRLQQQLSDAAVATGAELVAGRPVSVGGDGALRVWPARSPTLRTGSAAYGLSTDAEETYLAVSTLKEGIELWQVSGTDIRPLPDPAPPSGRTLSSAIAVAPNGTFLVGGTTKPHGELVVWPLSPKGAGDPISIPTFPDWYLGLVAVSADSSLIATQQYLGTKVALFARDYEGHVEPAGILSVSNPQSLAFSHDGMLLAIPTDDAVQLWDVGNPHKPTMVSAIDHSASTPSVATFANRSNALAIGTSTGEVSLWDISDRGAPVEQQSYRDPTAWINSLVFSPDDSTLVAGGGDNLVWAWRLDSTGAQAYLALDGQIGRTNDVRFLDGGRVLVGAGGDGDLKTWLFHSADARAALCDRRGAPLTTDEWEQYLPGVSVRDPC